MIHIFLTLICVYKLQFIRKLLDKKMESNLNVKMGVSNEMLNFSIWPNQPNLITDLISYKKEAPYTCSKETTAFIHHDFITFGSPWARRLPYWKRKSKTFGSPWARRLWFNISSISKFIMCWFYVNQLKYSKNLEQLSISEASQAWPNGKFIFYPQQEFTRRQVLSSLPTYRTQATTIFQQVFISRRQEREVN